MRWDVSWAAAALAAAVVVWGGSARADQASCKEFRDSIVKMEEASIRPPGWFALDSHLRAIYQSHCIDNPTPKRPIEYWYRADGTSTGVRTASEGEGAKAPPRPADAAYATTKEIGDACLKVASTKTRVGLDPSICALSQGAIAACANPVDNQKRSHCAMILGSPSKVAAIPRGEALPPLGVGLEGGPFVLDQECQNVLRQFGDDLALDDRGAQNRGGWLATMRAHCADFLDAIEKRAGIKAGDPTRFWPAFGELLLQGFATPQQMQEQKRQGGLGFINQNPDFRRMCETAALHMNTCAKHQQGMRSAGNAGPPGTATEGVQVGTFDECRQLYQSVHNMCATTTLQAERVASAQVKPAPKPQPAAQPQPQSQPQAKSADTQSRPPPAASPPTAPAAIANLSAVCKAQLNQLLEASDRRDGARATATYESLRANCDAGIRGVANEVNMAMPERQMGALSRRSFGRCLNDGDCGTAPSTPQQTAQAAANAFNVDEVLNFAFAAAGLAVGVAGFYAPTAGGAIVNSGQFSTINQRARSTYGQGGPTYVAPRTVPSDITGTRR
jgi:hypothetical protein